MLQLEGDSSHHQERTFSDNESNSARSASEALGTVYVSNLHIPSEMMPEGVGYLDKSSPIIDHNSIKLTH